MFARHSDLLTAPVPSAIIWLAVPNLVVVAIQVGLSILDTAWVGALGVEPLAGLSLVYPLYALVHMLSVGGMGAGVAAVVARSVGSRIPLAHVVSATVVLSLAIGGIFAVVMIGGGHSIFEAMGGKAKTLDQALTYSTVVFAGAPAFVLFNMLANVFRGGGNTFFPSAVFATGAVVHAGLSPALTFGLGPLPRLGIAGPAVSAVLFYGIGALVLLVTLARNSTLRPSIRARHRIRPSLVSILRIGLVASINTLQTNLAFFALTGFAASISTTTLAAYGLCARLEYLLNPLAFSIGQAMIAVVGANIAANNRGRAKRAIVVGSLIATALTASVGVIVALAPDLWLRMFTSDAAVRAVGADYFALVGPAYLFLGLGVALYSSCLAASEVAWPFLANLVRLVVVVFGGWILLQWHAAALFIVAPIGLLLFAGAMAMGTRGTISTPAFAA